MTIVVNLVIELSIYSVKLHTVYDILTEKIVHINYSNTNIVSRINVYIFKVLYIYIYI